MQALHRCDIPVDGPGFSRERLPQALPETFQPGGKVECLACDEDAVVNIRHRLPLHASRRHMVEGAPDRGALILHLPDVMQPHVPFVSRPMKRMRESASLVVPLEDQNAFAGVRSQQDRRRQPADAGADHDRIPCFCQLRLLVSNSARHLSILRVLR